jgi:bifunctional UDP-N-acetylglucosamine pyrophosphorylase/glucosamine-1-phosphate N-acetyltransferase
MKTLLLCGGAGKRMAPLIEDKFLFNFLGKTLLEHQLDLLVKAGLKDFILVCNPQNQHKVKEILMRVPVKATVVVQETPKGIADALEHAAHLFDDELLIINPNDLFELPALTALIETRCCSAAKSYMVGHVVSEYFPGGYLVADEKRNLSHIVEKPGKGNEPSNLVNLLVHLHTEPAVLMDYLHHVRSDRDDVYEQAVDAMCKDNNEIRVVPYSGAWHAIKYPWNLLDFVHLFLDKADLYISPTAQISERAVIHGKVIVEDDVRIMGNAVINGPVYLGRGTVVGYNTQVGEYTHIGSNCVIGFASEIKGSYVENECRFYMNRIGDSIVGDHCKFGAGTHTANSPLDGQTVRVRIGSDLVDSGKGKLGAIIGSDCQFGPDVRILPGIKIGAGAIVAPSACVAEDILPSTAVATVSGSSKVTPVFQTA